MAQISATKERRLREIIREIREYSLYPPTVSAGLAERSATAYRSLVIQFQRLASEVLPDDRPAWKRLNSIAIDPEDIHSAYVAKAEVDVIVLDVEEVLDVDSAHKKVIPVDSLELLLRDKDIPTVREEFARCVDNINSDPRAAITAACAMVEATCKVYIEDQDLEMPSRKAIKSLWSAIASDLEIEPASVEDKDVKRILSGLISVVDGLGSLRTHTGSAHGGGRKRYKVQPRHARLAAGAACTLVGLILETWDQRTTNQ